MGQRAVYKWFAVLKTLGLIVQFAPGYCNLCRRRCAATYHALWFSGALSIVSHSLRCSHTTLYRPVGSILDSCIGVPSRARGFRHSIWTSTGRTLLSSRSCTSRDDLAGDTNYRHKHVHLLSVFTWGNRQVCSPSVKNSITGQWVIAGGSIR